jgi:HAD superfamily hydrolase (TIGR01509 family)
MIKLLIFDLDGVLIDSKDAHYVALNNALMKLAPEYVISLDDHINIYDGLPTQKKLAMLAEKGLSDDLIDPIKKLKQKYTTEYLELFVHEDDKLVSMFKSLRDDGYKIHVASNAVRYTVEFILWRKGLMKYVNYVISNEDVSHPKPNPEMYLKCMIREGVGPKETLIIEDSSVGRQGVYNSGAFLGPVNTPSDVTLERLRFMISQAGEHPARPKWKDDSLNVLVPMAGAGSRFAQAGYTFPKPLIEVMGKPMIQVVVDNLNIEAHYIFVVQKSHYEKYNLKYVLNMIAPGCDIVQVDGVTEGAACTTLLAKDHIDNGKQLLIANSDQWIDWDSNDFMYTMQGEAIDGGILTFPSTHPKWSYAKFDKHNNLTELQEKKPISEHATVGIYYWKRGSDYVKFAEQMIEKDIRVNNEFYVAPVYNEAVPGGKVIKNYPVSKMMGIGTPEDLTLFLDYQRSQHDSREVK